MSLIFEKGFLTFKVLSATETHYRGMISDSRVADGRNEMVIRRGENMISKGWVETIDPIRAVLNEMEAAIKLPNRTITTESKRWLAKYAQQLSKVLDGHSS